MRGLFLSAICFSLLAPPIYADASCSLISYSDYQSMVRTSPIVDSVTDKYVGNYEVRSGTDLRGLITGSATVDSGAFLEAYGMVGGDLMVGWNGTALIYGVVGGDLTVHNGLAGVYGQVSRSVHNRGGVVGVFGVVQGSVNCVAGGRLYEAANSRVMGGVH